MNFDELLNTTLDLRVEINYDFDKNNAHLSTIEALNENTTKKKFKLLREQCQCEGMDAMFTPVFCAKVIPYINSQRYKPTEWLICKNHVIHEFVVFGAIPNSPGFKTFEEAQTAVKQNAVLFAYSEFPQIIEKAIQEKTRTLLKKVG